MMDDVFRRMRDSARQQEYNALNPQTPVTAGATGTMAGMGSTSGKKPESALGGFGMSAGLAGATAAKSKGQKPPGSVGLARLGRALIKG